MAKVLEIDAKVELCSFCTSCYNIPTRAGIAMKKRSRLHGDKCAQISSGLLLSNYTVYLFISKEPQAMLTGGDGRGIRTFICTRKVFVPEFRCIFRVVSEEFVLVAPEFSVLQLITPNNSRDGDGSLRLQRPKSEQHKVMLDSASNLGRKISV